MDRRAVIDRLAKIRRLIEQGSRGEAEAARARYDAILSKYGISDDEVVKGSELLAYVFNYRTKLERQLLIQVWAKVISNSRNIHPEQEEYYSYRGRRALEFELTEAEGEEMERLVAIYEPALRDGIEQFFNAFIQRNELYSCLPSKNPRKFDPEELEELLALAKSIKKVQDPIPEGRRLRGLAN